MEMQRPYKEKLWELNQLSPLESDKKAAYLKQAFAECGENCFIEGPFHASCGGKNVHFGNRIYANYNLTFLDDGHIYVGDRVLFGPNVTVITAAHLIEPELRRKEMQYNRDVHIGENTWIGAGSIILPGITIGKNVVIGAGSVATRDIPDNVVTVGNPCNVLRNVTRFDYEFYHHDQIIDWENLRDYVKNKVM